MTAIPDQAVKIRYLCLEANWNAAEATLGYVVVRISTNCLTQSDSRRQLKISNKSSNSNITQHSNIDDCTSAQMKISIYHTHIVNSTCMSLCKPSIIVRNASRT